VRGEREGDRKRGERERKRKKKNILGFLG